MDVQTFRVLMTYLYLGRLPSLDGSDIVGLLEAADRLCLKHMIKALEYEIVSELLQAEANGDKIVEETLKLIEPAQVNKFKLSCLSSSQMYFLVANEFAILPKI